MQPITDLKNADNLPDTPTNDGQADAITLRKVFAAIGAKLRAIFSARHAPEITHEDAATEDVLGEQVILPSAFVKEISTFTRKDGRG